MNWIKNNLIALTFLVALGTAIISGIYTVYKDGNTKKDPTTLPTPSVSIQSGDVTQTTTSGTNINNVESVTFNQGLTKEKDTP